MNISQQKALDTKLSVWVDASAGTGKTKILVDRTLRLLLEGVLPKKILCLTFTNVSAAEMNNRINAILQKWATLSDDKLKEELEVLFNKGCSDQMILKAKKIFLEMLDSSDFIKVQTIHSFCQMLISKFPVEAGVIPNVSIADETKSLEMLEEAKMRLFNNISEDKASVAVKKAIRNISCNIHENNFTNLINEVLSNRSKLESMLNYAFDKVDIKDSFYGKTDEAINLLYDTVGLDINKTSTDFLEEICKTESFSYENLFLAASKMLESSKKTDIQNGGIIQKWLISPVIERANIFESDYIYAFLTKDHEKRSKIVTKDILERDPEIDIYLKDEQSRILEAVDKIKSYKIAELTSDLLHVSDAILVLYKEAKDSQALIDYFDLINFTVKLLSMDNISSWILYKLDSRIDHIMVDEAQDTSPEQWFIIKKLCEDFYSQRLESKSAKDSTLFVVGDEKQSIYSFQGADIKYFSSMRKFFKKKIVESGRTWCNIPLEKSYRSVPVILQFVDSVFNNSKITKSVVSESQKITHISNRIKEYGKVELWPLVASDDLIKKENTTGWPIPNFFLSEDDNYKKLASSIATEIFEWLKNKKILLSKGRRVQPKDIMILVRYRNNLPLYITSELKKYNIPVSGLDRIKLKDHIAVQDIISLSNFILLPSDDLMLATILKSPFFGIREEDLFDLCIGRGKKSLWEVLKERRKDKDIYEKSCLFIEDLFEKSKVMTVFDFFSYILIIKEKKRLLAERLGEEIFDLIDEFLSLVIDYEKNNISSLQGFLHWFRISNAEVKRDFDNKMDQVKIMTIHAAKGLQSPIVFLPDTTSVPRFSNSIFWQYNANKDKPVMLWAGSVANYNQNIRKLKSEIESDQYDEYLRLLYVAMTRAEDEIYIAGIDDKKDISRSWYSILEETIKQSIDVKNKEGRLFLECNQDNKDIALKENLIKEDEKLEKLEIPKLLYQKIEKNIDAPSIAPSLMNLEKKSSESFFIRNKKFKIGNLVHKLFEILPSIDSRDLKCFIEKIKKDYLYYVKESEINSIIAKVTKIINDPEFSFLFLGHAMVEVEVAGKINGRNVFGTIDRLVFIEDKVIILDYKYSRGSEEDLSISEESYLYQMTLYNQLIKDIYPGLKVECYLLFYKNYKLLKINEKLLEEYYNKIL